MCNSAIALITKALDKVDNAEVLLKIKGVIALFIQTMGVSQCKLLSLLRLIHSRDGATLCQPWTTSCSRYSRNMQNFSREDSVTTFKKCVRLIVISLPS